MLWVAVRVEFGALDSNGGSLCERSRLVVRVKIRGLFGRYGHQNRDLTAYRMSILASEGIEPLFRLEKRTARAFNNESRMVNLPWKHSFIHFHLFFRELCSSTYTLR